MNPDPKEAPATPMTPEQVDNLWARHANAGDVPEGLSALCDSHEALRARLDRTERENERLRVQLAGCSVAALSNTPETYAAGELASDAYGFSASYQDVRAAVGRFIALRQTATRLARALEPFAEFARKWNAKPLSSTDDRVYSIHAGKDEGVLRLSDCRAANAALSDPLVASLLEEVRDEHE